MDSSSQLTIAYDMLYYVKLAALSIKTICRTLTLFVFSLNAELAKFPEIAGAEFLSKKFILK